MNEFSLEVMSEKIYNHKTKEYFKEIVSSYNNENYRSATVMLWSVVIIDLVFKLNDLVDLHSDRAAESILKQIKSKKEKDKKSSAWENSLVKDIEARTQLLSTDDISFLEYLYQQRNLSAHPVLNSNLELHRPNKVTVRSLIVNSIEGVLSKPPFFSKDIVSTIAVDLSESKAYLENDSGKLKFYLESRFLSKMSTNVELEVFKALWKFVFLLENDKTVENRNINFQALSYIYEKNREKALKFIGNEGDYFSDISKKPETISYLIRFLSLNAPVYSKLKKSAHVLVENVVEKNIKDYFKSNFLYSSLTEFQKALIAKIDGDNQLALHESYIKFLYLLSDAPEWKTKVRVLRNTYYGNSASYAQAEERFAKYISSELSRYGKEELIDLISRANSNSQIYDRSYNKHINKNVKLRCDEVLGADFDYTPYIKFKEASQ